MELHLQVSMDQFGRIVLPKPLRDRLGIKPGANFLIFEEKEKIILNPAPSASILKKKQGLIVASPQKDYSESLDIIKNERQERDKKF